MIYRTNERQRQTRGAFPEMGKVPSEAEADEGEAFALSLKRGKKLVLRIAIVT